MTCKKTLIVVRNVVMLFAAAMIIILLSVNAIVCGTTRERIVSVERAALLSEEFDCILVLGAGVKADGSPSNMLEDRLTVGVELYFAEASDCLLMSGDHMQHDYNEVGVMKSYAEAAGVPGNRIFLDHAGLSTYESLWRAKEIYGVEKVLIATQRYHLHRALYIAKALGMEAYGVSADLRTYRDQGFLTLREVVARNKDFVFSLVKPAAQYLGEAVDLSGDGDATNENPLLSQ